MLKSKYVSLFLSAILVVSTLSLYGCNSSKRSKSGDEKVLNVFTWANYIPDAVVKDFEKDTGIKVNYSPFSSNEEMLTKLQAVNGGQYDVIVCSDYIIQLMTKQKNVLLKPIIKSKIPNFKNVNPVYLKQYYDKTNRYSIPYVAGSEMIVYNSDKIKTPITSYKQLWNPSYKNSIALLDDERSVIGMALKVLGYGINETDPKKLDQAKKLLKKLKPNVKVFDADTPHKSLISGDCNIGVMYGSQASAAVKADPKFKIAYPKEGMNVSIDNFVIPIKAPHEKNAEKFINYMLSGKESSKASKIIEYLNTNTDAKKYMSKSYLNNKAVFIPEKLIKSAQHLVDVGSSNKTYDAIWTEFKQE
ncbi:polyamine ABC transporter substrate-binding protein [Clostridium oryzae]|uniref:Spermidine/putrescine-binding periplasmic protein n=1 Tax=Clostridium oryzae TaxID=1450648 RepID=A0A1V4IL89_9CLOT|nr:spermidine/putrescine ABC transporter substrate-binding protein [Clostridium oryzae]OPJ60505.1 spermidine/putrescine-binding periplasmic protein precursor [Clostridium oryzae]